MKRLLFVDDEPRILEAIENMLFDGPEDWEVITAQSGEEALRIMDEEPVDVLVTDMRMPGMDGAQVLEAVREKHPQVPRFVLTGHADTGPLLRAMAVSHQVLLKPCSPEMLIHAIERVFDLDRILSSERIRGMVGRLPHLPAQPKLYFELSGLLARETTSISEVAELIEKDLSISAQLLHLANSAFFYRGRSCGSIQEAISRLGLNTVHGVVLELEVGQALGGVPQELYDHVNSDSRIVSNLARAIGSEFECEEDAYVAGVLHDVGRLLLALLMPKEFQAASADWAGLEFGGIEELEREEFGASHGEVGAYLLGVWGMPYPVIEAVARHHDFARSGSLHFNATDALQIACRLVDEVSVEDPPAYTEEEERYLRKVGAMDRMDDWRRSLDRIREALAA